jgi:GNAT superfamily N-acetyltransferase
MRPMASVNRRRREKQARIDYQLLRSNGAHWNATVALVTLRVQPLTPNLWPAIEDLFEGATACNHCWCMYWRIGRAYTKRPREANKDAFHRIVQKGPPPGLLAFDGATAVGWCQLSLRDSLPYLNRSSFLKPIDELPVWCISCFYVRKGYRRQGVTSALVREALNIARDAGAPALEAYPLDRDLTDSSSWTGFASTFLRLGFKCVARRRPPRPIMRYTL